MKSNSNEVTGFCDKKISNGDSSHTCLSITSLDSALKKDGKYYWQVFLWKLIKRFFLRVASVAQLAVFKKWW